jgi:A/G-specific adenine glycosylase
MPAYTQGMMDLGATVCTRRAPDCAACPVGADCVALRTDRVEALPTPRRRRAPTTRRACFLLAIADGAVLLEQRPPSGVWGGLLAPPQFDSAAALRRALAALAPDAQARALPARRHGFTHFTLAYTPYLAQVRPPPRLAEPRQRWIALAHVDAVALPAPMRALLREVGERRATSGPRAASGTA